MFNFLLNVILDRKIATITNTCFTLLMAHFIGVTEYSDLKLKAVITNGYLMPASVYSENKYFSIFK